MDYKIFTKEYDRVITADTLLAERDAKPGCEATSEAMLDHFEPMLDKLVKAPVEGIGDGAALTILVDCSGSTRGMIAWSMAASIRAMGDKLAESGRPFEVLGFTTGGWKGGQSRGDWEGAGRPVNPGRLNETLHIIFKDIDEDWAKARRNVAAIADTSYKKENFDGEAVLWAQDRIKDRGRESAILLLSDGAPGDDSTLAFNPREFLNEHFIDVVNEIDTPVQLVKLEYGHPRHVKPVLSDEILVEMSNNTTPEQLTAMTVAAMREAVIALDKKIPALEPGF